MENNQLYHHGIKGMRWGVRRFQNSDGSLTAAGKKRRSLIQVVKDRKAAKAKAKADEERRAKRVENLAKAREAKKSKAELEAEKQKAITSGNADEVLKYKGKLTNNELLYAINRLNFEKQLSQISAANVKTGQDKVNEIISKVETGKKAVEKGIEVWNLAAKINNSLSPHELPIIDGQSKAKKAVNEAKAKLIKSGTAEQIQKNLGKFSDDEMAKITKRWAFEDNVNKRVNANKKPKPDDKSDDKPDTKSDNESDTSNNSSSSKAFDAFKKMFDSGKYDKTTSKSEPNTTKSKSKDSDDVEKVVGEVITESEYQRYKQGESWASIKGNLLNGPVSDVSDSTRSAGESFVNSYLLEDKNNR